MFEAGSVESRRAIEGVGKREKPGRKGAWRKAKRAVRRALGGESEWVKKRKEEEQPRVWVDTYFPVRSRFLYTRCPIPS